MTWLLLSLAIAADPAELVPVAVPEPSPLAMDYYRSGVAIWSLMQAWGLIVPAFLLFSGLSGRMRDVACRISGGPDNKFSGPPGPSEVGAETPLKRGFSWFGTIAIYAVLYLVLTYLIDLPLDYYLGYVRPHHYGLSNRTIGRWFEEGLKGLAVSAVVAALFLWVPYLVLARGPRRWWLWTGLLTLPFAVGGALVKPIWIDPQIGRASDWERARRRTLSLFVVGGWRASFGAIT